MVLDFRHPEDRLERAVHRFHEGRVSEARLDLEELLSMGFNSGEVHLYLGHCELERGELGPALLHYRDARKKQPHRAEIWLGLGVVAARRLHFRRAIRMLRRTRSSRRRTTT